MSGVLSSVLLISLEDRGWILHRPSQANKKCASLELL